MVASKKRKSLRELPVGWQRRRKVAEGHKDAKKFTKNKTGKLVPKSRQKNYEKPKNPKKSPKFFNELVQKWKKLTKYPGVLTPKQGTKAYTDMKTWMRTQGWEGK